ncbi:DUF2333 family protein [Dongia deserti]|uniref:DUF2333 family protein n=1 Tax=Dongia deserti TaxID=2268030 RepID=UPI000E64B046|nr:DUF2333 family protein [Dongia deserti]
MTADPFLDSPADQPQLPGSGRRWARRAKWAGLVVLAVLLLYYPVGMLLVHRINDDPEFAARDVPQGGSQAVALAAALIQREVQGTAWPANDPFFMPGYALDNMPNYQIGIQQALARFSTEMADQIGRSRGSSSTDRDLTDARGALNYAPDKWYFEAASITANSESQYRGAMVKLLSYNDRLARGQAPFEPRADNLMATLDRIGKDLGSASSAIDQQIDQHSGDWFDFYADNVFYLNKGRLYAYGLLLRDLGADFKAVIQEKGATTVWQRMVDSMLEGAVLQPIMVINGTPHAMMQPNHLAAQGFYLLRARIQLEEITDILQK